MEKSIGGMCNTPMVAMAASCGEENYCCLECEKYILRKLLIEFDEQQLMIDAISRGWLKTEGTALHNVGRHMERKGLIVKRQYNCTLDDLHNYLKEKKYVIAAVDGGELLGNRKEELIEDTIIGQIPDHTVVVLAYDAETKIITIFDPNSDKVEDCYPLEQFMNAWADSKNYLAIVSSQDMETYVPYVIDLSDVVLSDELIELREAIAEHAHNVWAAERQAQGWTYGPQRDDEKKQTPCMVPYSKLPDSEKTFDRDMAMNTIKLLKKLGYDIVKR